MTQRTLHYDLIALDVDGTTLNSREMVSTRTRKALHEAVARGAEVVLCTGRGPTNTFHVVEMLGLPGVIITHNGAATVDARTSEVIHTFALQAEQLAPYIADCRAGGHHWDINTTFELMTDSIGQQAAEMYAKYRVDPIVIPHIEYHSLPDGLLKMTMFGEEQACDQLEAFWDHAGYELVHIRSGKYFIDIMHPEANKGAALKAYVEGLALPIAQARIIAVGNYFNDVQLFQYAGLGVAVADSPDGVRAAADAVTLGHDEDGVAVAVEHYVLGEPAIGIRSWTANDAEFVREMVFQAIYVAPGEPAPARELLNKPEIKQYYENIDYDNEIGYVAYEVERKTRVGLVMARLLPNGYGFVHTDIRELTLVVDEAQRGMQIGTRLLDVLLDNVQEPVSLSVNKDNPVVRLYERSGFRKMGEDETMVRYP